MAQKLWFRIGSRQGDEMTSPMALEARAFVFEVARDASPGLTVGGKLRFVCRELGYPDGSWRIHDAWYLRAGCWSAQGYRDFQNRVLAWRERRAKRAAHETLLQAQRDRELLERLRAEHRAALALVERQLAACEAALRLPDPDAPCP